MTEMGFSHKFMWRSLLFWESCSQ